MELINERLTREKRNQHRPGGSVGSENPAAPAGGASLPGHRPLSLNPDNIHVFVWLLKIRGARLC